MADRLVQAAAGVAVLGILLAVTGAMPGALGAAAVFLAAALLGVAFRVRTGTLCPPPAPAMPFPPEI